MCRQPHLLLLHPAWGWELPRGAQGRAVTCWTQLGRAQHAQVRRAASQTTCCPLHVA